MLIFICLCIFVKLFNDMIRDKMYDKYELKRYVTMI